MELYRSGWHDDFETLVYFEIYDRYDRVWCSTWYDIRELSEDNNVDVLREEVKSACLRYGANFNLSNLDNNDCMQWAWPHRRFTKEKVV